MFVSNENYIQSQSYLNINRSNCSIVDTMSCSMRQRVIMSIKQKYEINNQFLVNKSKSYSTLENNTYYSTTSQNTNSLKKEKHPATRIMLNQKNQSTTKNENTNSAKQLCVKVDKIYKVGKPNPNQFISFEETVKNTKNNQCKNKQYNLTIHNRKYSQSFQRSRSSDDDYHHPFRIIQQK